ncbi:hypothetical protein OUZ56_013833 [Daphnia magna]|uniref:Homeobox protein abdominal-A n=1 Tax=Daphnia magna TaxID=35525 RepID=A0ABQ9Z728_9CRUS|nr:hypothetical protein OUZ56_013833 [Daphnia magna]
MSSKFLDSMLTKYQAEAAGAAAVAAGGSSYSSQHARMYPYVSAMGQSGFPGGVAGYSNALANAAESAAAATAAAAQADKQCRYTGSAAAAASMAEAMVNYSLGAAHQNGVAGAAAASMAQAAAANFYQQAASAGGAAAAAAAAAVGVDPNNPLSACSQGGPPAGLGALTGVHSGGGPDIPRYPWMSITGSFASHDGFSHAGICSGRRYSTLFFFFFCLVFFVLRRYFPTNNLKEKSRCHYARHFPPFKLMDIGIDSTAPFFVR